MNTQSLYPNVMQVPRKQQIVAPPKAPAQPAAKPQPCTYYQWAGAEVQQAMQFARAEAQKASAQAYNQWAHVQPAQPQPMPVPVVAPITPAP